jgi:hypothetical protein
LLVEQLDQGHYAQALDLVDRIWRIAPGKQVNLYPVMIALTERPKFANALADKLSARPPWGGSFVSLMMTMASLEGIESVATRLQQRDALDASGLGQWIDRLAKDDKWGEAYARWAGELPLSDIKTLRSVYNGGFESEPSGTGFDWRGGKSVDVIIDREGHAGSGSSFAVRLRFLGRRTENIPLHQWLLLSPGTYHLRFRARAQDLHSDRGLQWVIRCLDDHAELAASDSVSGSLSWTEFNVDFEVPERNCPAQDLALHNAGSKGAGRILAGTVWFDDVSVDR